MRDVDRGDVETLLQFADLAAHLDPQSGVEIGQWLVEQQHFRSDHQGAGDGDALQLATRQLMRPTLAVTLQLNQRQRVADSLCDLAARYLARFETVSDVAGRPSGWERSRSSETPCRYCADAAAAFDALPADADLPAVELSRPGDHAQQRGLAAAGRAEQREEFSRP